MPAPPNKFAAPPNTGSLQRRMILIAAAWISVLLAGGGLFLDSTLSGLVTRNFDDQLGSRKRWSPSGRLKNTSPSGPTSAEATIAVSM